MCLHLRERNWAEAPVFSHLENRDCGWLGVPGHQSGLKTQMDKRTCMPRITFGLVWNPRHTYCSCTTDIVAQDIKTKAFPTCVVGGWAKVNSSWHRVSLSTYATASQPVQLLLTHYTQSMITASDIQNDPLWVLKWEWLQLSQPLYESLVYDCAYILTCNCCWKLALGQSDWIKIWDVDIMRYPHNVGNTDICHGQ